MASGGTRTPSPRPRGASTAVETGVFIIVVTLLYTRYVQGGEGGRASDFLLSVCTSTPSPGGRPFLALWHQRLEFEARHLLLQSGNDVLAGRVSHLRGHRTQSRRDGHHLIPIG